MLSGNGRHRRPRQAPALLVAAGVTGSAIAIPLLGAGGASAADGTVWDQVAECESGGSWSANTGNGHYGGLQMSQADWEAYGGLDYAPSADQASRSQQIAVAEGIFADRGALAWPACGVLGGLVGEDSAADAGTGGTGGSTGSNSSGGNGSSDSSAPTPGTGASGTGSTGSASQGGDSAGGKETGDGTGASGASTAEPGDPGASASGDDSAEPGEGGGSPGATEEDPAAGTASDASSASPSASASASASTDETAGTGRHRGGSADEEPAGAVTDGSTASTGRHAAREDVVAERTGGAYTMRSGDGLWAAAASSSTVAG
ncbi:peptidoglycan-binding protein LysM [Streptomyces ruber]|uniref:Peptidoglycan-binding protein LysM n=3 Tax=Streptomyces TaxID=1883 RepID=A0A918EUC5_9ACTN|nr:peptidoglycan-binding protein LysM [Streptomyces ruber]